MIDQAELHAALQKVFQRAATDDQFRQKCLTDPVSAMQEAGGICPPPGFRFRFVEKPVEALFLLPPLRAADGEAGGSATFQQSGDGSSPSPTLVSNP